ncbi:hypothetical protein FRX31_035350 [Thalictrum thalictroides]|uniref:Uncharacterized protein n=1 Tax=Thalictrum thalictroides TaxID=46969 RepID=A0A7J6UR59_THATH|nr:hypothetical protein FRX31_035350 [Thalictrum thalictroides]
MLMIPPTVLPKNCRVEVRTPLVGNEELQVTSGVPTIRLQPVRSDERTNWSGFNRIENTPAALVVALATTFPVPHCSCTRASAREKPSKLSKIELTWKHRGCRATVGDASIDAAKERSSDLGQPKDSSK